MLGKRLKELRKSKKLTAKQFGEKFNLAESTISGYETESRKPDIELLQRFAGFFEVSTDYLLGLTDFPDGHSSDLSTPEKVENPEAYDSLSEINKLVKQYGIEQMGFFDIEKWKNLSPHDVKMIEEHFKMIVKLAEEREKEEKST
ncbi:helix-turn-helix domain-containing protein [Peribacillus asahii]|uniref:helix-turn-helix domain-containing protein n=1 Tax=Peribacillus asahii TaxID=228899 RepID=UPI0020794952|nr:helix-turn-helix transcriptional regulator [Peribacillus asahii]USK85695.1 helix-turn-helix domain-containing protein [Peribacillus asahii]